MYNAISRKTMGNVRKHRDIKFFIEHLLAIEIIKTQVHMNKPVYLGLSVLEISTMVTYVFLYEFCFSLYP